MSTLPASGPQVSTIQRNVDEGQINALEALVLYKRTRRDGRANKKRVELANTPVTRRPTKVSAPCMKTSMYEPRTSDTLMLSVKQGPFEMTAP